MTRKTATILIIVSCTLLILAALRPVAVRSMTSSVLGAFTDHAKALTAHSGEPGLRNMWRAFQSKKARSASAGLTGESIIAETNKERIKATLPALQPNSLLNASAKLKVEDMIAKQYFEHVSPTNQSVSDLGTEVGYEYIIMGENLALGDFESATDLLQAWMNSPGHRANIVNTSYTEIGVYAGRGLHKGQEVWYAVQHFGAPRSACPSISGDLKYEVDKLNAELKSREVEIQTLRARIETFRRSNNNAEYRALVGSFNQLVGEYNNVLKISQQRIKLYNAQVTTFNECLSAYQKGGEGTL